MQLEKGDIVKGPPSDLAQHQLQHDRQLEIPIDSLSVVKAVCFLDFFPSPAVSLPPSAQRLLRSFWFITQTCPEGRLLSPPELPCPLLPGPIHQGNRLEENRSCQPEINHSSEQHQLLIPAFPASSLPESFPDFGAVGSGSAQIMDTIPGSSLCQLGIHGWKVPIHRCLGKDFIFIYLFDFISLFIFINHFRVRKQILCCCM